MQTIILFAVWLGFACYLLATEYKETGGTRRRHFRRVRG